MEHWSAAMAEAARPTLSNVLAVCLDDVEAGGSGGAALQVGDGLVIRVLVQRVGLQGRHDTTLCTSLMTGMIMLTLVTVGVARAARPDQSSTTLPV